MKSTLKITLYVGAVVTASLGWFVLTLPLALGFAIVANPVWLIPAAVVIDGYFGAWYSIPWLTLLTSGFFVMMELVRPHIMWHNEGIK